MNDLNRPSTIYAIPRNNSASNRGIIKEFRGPLLELTLLPDGTMKLGKSHSTFFELRKEQLLWETDFGPTPILGWPKHFQQLEQSPEQVGRERLQEYLQLHRRNRHPYRRPFSDPLVIANLHERQSKNSPLQRRFQPQIQITGTIIQWEDLTHGPLESVLTIESGPAFKMLESAVLWIPDDHPILKDYSVFTTLPNPNGKPMIYADRAEGDLLREHLIRGRQVWLVKTENGKREINFEKTAAFDDARMVFVTQQHTIPLKKFCQRGEINCIKNLKSTYNVSSFCNLKEEVEKSKQAAKEEEERPRYIEHSGGLVIDRGLIDAFVGGNARLSLAIKQAGLRAHIARYAGLYTPELCKVDKRASWSRTRKTLEFLRDPVMESVEWWRRMRTKSQQARTKLQQAVIEAQFASCGPFMPPPLNPNPGEDACECGPVCQLNKDKIDPIKKRVEEQDIEPKNNKQFKQREILKHIPPKPVPTYVDEMKGMKGKEIPRLKRHSTIHRKIPFFKPKHASELQHRPDTPRPLSPVSPMSVTPKSKPWVIWDTSTQMKPPPGCNQVLYRRQLPVDRYDCIRAKATFPDELQKIRWFMNLVDRGDYSPSDWANPKNIDEQWGPNIQIIFLKGHQEFSRQEKNNDMRKAWNKYYPLPTESFYEVDLFPSPVVQRFGSSEYEVLPPMKEGSIKIIDTRTIAPARSVTSSKGIDLPPPMAPPRPSLPQFPSFSAAKPVRRLSSKSPLKREKQDSLLRLMAPVPLDESNIPPSLAQKGNSSESRKCSETLDDPFESFEDNPSPLTHPAQFEFSTAVETSTSTSEAEQAVLFTSSEQGTPSILLDGFLPDSPTLPPHSAPIQPSPGRITSAVLSKAVISELSNQGEPLSTTLEGLQSNPAAPTNPRLVESFFAVEISISLSELVLSEISSQGETSGTSLVETPPSTHVTLTGGAGYQKNRASSSKDLGYDPMNAESQDIEERIEATDWAEVKQNEKGKNGTKELLHLLLSSNFPYCSILCKRRVLEELSRDTSLRELTSIRVYDLIPTIIFD